MKIITLLPVKNEAWILPYSLKNFSDFSDYIIVANQNSTDATLEICSKFPKVKVIENKNIEHTNKVRWNLLEEARKIGGDNNLIVCLDADELIDPHFIEQIKKTNCNESIVFYSSWLQLYKETNLYRVDSVWEDNTKEFCFIDNKKINYSKTEIINDHTGRTPYIEKKKYLETPILHPQYLAQKRSQIKQAWYMCQEKIKNKNPKKINLKYSVAKFKDNIKTKEIKPEWIENIDLPPKKIFETHNTEQLEDIFNIFKIYTSLFFEPLDIWHIDELRNIFIKENDRIPKPKLFPKWLIVLNNFKNKIIK